MEKKTKMNAWLQIFLPLVILFAAVGTAAYFLVFNGESTLDQLNRAGNIAAIYLVFLLMVPIFITIIVLVIFILINFRLSRSVSAAFPKIAGKADQVNHIIRTASSASAKSFIEVNARLGAFKSCLSKKESNGK